MTIDVGLRVCMYPVIPVEILARKIWGHGPMAGAVREPIMGVTAPCEVQKQSPWSESQGLCPLKLTAF